DAKRTILKQRRQWVAQGRPHARTNPGHERYQLKVALDRPGSHAGQGAGTDQASSAEAGKAQKERPVSGPGGKGEDIQKAALEAGEKAAQGKGGSSAAQGEGESSSGNVALAAEVRARLKEMRASLKDRRSAMQDTVKSLKDRVSSLSDQVKEQKSLIAKQSAAVSRIANQPAAAGNMPGRDRYILWMLAGINLLMLLAILALWRKVRGVQAVPAAGDVADGEPGEGFEPDPLSRANAQAAAGEFKQARSTLWEALALEPRNWALYGRLLDLYEQEGDPDQFEEVARRLFSQLGGEHQEWQEEIQGRGRQLKPESTLFAGLSTEPSTGGDTFDWSTDDLDLGMSGGEEPEEVQEPASVADEG
ncbi:MAG TPA: hypothetical protein VKA48_04605, partial [Gammaproteobacteria bacterium]|nr:hypothetical protein [Gammaproteobacteria bacterium]